jgi:hypothetical protein
MPDYSINLRRLMTHLALAIKGIVEILYRKAGCAGSA